MQVLLSESDDEDVRRFWRRGWQEAGNLGFGARGAVRLVRPTLSGLGRPSALKRSTAEEVAALQALSLCESLVRLEEHFGAGERVWARLEWLEGGSLRDLLRSSAGRSLPEPSARFVVSEVLRALRGIHRAGWMHRDVKAENLGLTMSCGANLESEGCRVKLLDFDSAVQLHGAGKMLTEVVGTVENMAPEVFCGSYDERADCWSLGVVAYETLYGYRPFNDVSIDHIEEMIRNWPKYFMLPLGAASPAAEDFLRQMLTGSHERLSSHAAAAHTWISGLCEAAPPVPVVQRLPGSPRATDLHDPAACAGGSSDTIRRSDTTDTVNRSKAQAPHVVADLQEGPRRDRSRSPGIVRPSGAAFGDESDSDYLFRVRERAREMERRAADSVSSVVRLGGSRVACDGTASWDDTHLAQARERAEHSLRGLSTAAGRPTAAPGDERGPDGSPEDLLADARARAEASLRTLAAAAGDTGQYDELHSPGSAWDESHIARASSRAGDALRKLSAAAGVQSAESFANPCELEQLRARVQELEKAVLFVRDEPHHSPCVPAEDACEDAHLIQARLRTEDLLRRLSLADPASPPSGPPGLAGVASPLRHRPR